MGESRYAKKPLMYIEQQGIRSPKAEMQSSYRSTSQREPSIIQTGEESGRLNGKRANRKKRNIFHEQLMPVDPIEEMESADVVQQHEEDGELSAGPSAAGDGDLHEAKGEQETAPVEGGIARTPFNKLDLRGKVDYFLNKPLLVPALKCEVRTMEEAHFGVIEQFEKGIVRMRKKRKNELTDIPFGDIVSIRLLGF